MNENNKTEKISCLSGIYRRNFYPQSKFEATVLTFPPKILMHKHIYETFTGKVKILLVSAQTESAQTPPLCHMLLGLGV